MHTEDEARGKWCPFARQPIHTENGVEPGLPPINRLPMKDNSVSIPSQSKCIASDCMAWRSTKWKKEVIAAGGYDQDEPPTIQPMGYCGLAGEPE